MDLGSICLVEVFSSSLDSFCEYWSYFLVTFVSTSMCLLSGPSASLESSSSLRDNFRTSSTRQLAYWRFSRAIHPSNPSSQATSDLPPYSPFTRSE
jgi:hypothetical protein